MAYSKVCLLLIVCLACASSRGDEVSLGDFGKDLNGWRAAGKAGSHKAEIRKLENGGKFLRVSLDFSSEKSDYAGVAKSLHPPLAVDKIKFRAKTVSQLTRLTVSMLKEPDQKWELRSIPLVCDGQWHEYETEVGLRLCKISLVIPSTSIPAGIEKVEIDFCDLRAEVSDKKLTQLIPANPSAMFMAPQKESHIIFRVHETDKPEETDFVITDYNGTMVEKGKTSIDEENRSCSIAVNLPPGFFEVSFPSTAQRFGLVCLPPFSGERDPFFGINTIFSTMQRHKVIDLNTAPDYFRILKRSGIFSARELLHWFALERERGKWEWDTRLTDSLEKLAKENSIDTLYFFNRAPQWTGARIGYVNHQPIDDFQPFPTDIFATAESLSTIIDRLSPRCGLQVWNELEHLSNGCYPGDIAAFMAQAMSWTFRNYQPRLTILGSALAGPGRERKQLDPYFKNGFLEYIDAFTFHTYYDADKTVNMVVDFRKAMSGYPRANLPIWITESGKPWPVGPQRPLAEADKISAKEIIGKVIEAKACGVEKIFPFSFTWFEEQHNNFGMMGRNHTPLRSMAAYIHCILTLANQCYVGDIRIHGVEKARVFVGSDSAVVVLFTGTAGSKTVANLGFAPEKITAIDGALIEQSSNSFVITGGIAYLRLNDSVFRQISRKLDKKTEAYRLMALAKSFVDTPRKASPLVFRYDFLQASSRDMYGYMIVPEIKVKAVNFSEKAMRVDPYLAVPAGIKIIGSSVPNGGMMVAPRTEIDLSWHIDYGRYRKSSAEFRVVDRNKKAQNLCMMFHNPIIKRIIAPPALKTSQGTGQKWVKINALKVFDKNNPPKNFQARFQATWTAKSIRLKIEVLDKTFCQPFHGRDMWKGDSVQVAFQNLKNGQRQMRNTEITAALTASGSELYRHSAESSKSYGSKLERSSAQISFDKGKLSYLLDIDAAETDLDQLYAGKIIPFSLVVNNSDGGIGRTAYLFWGEGVVESKNPLEYNELILTD